MGWTDILKYASYVTPFIPGVNAFSPYIIGGATALDQAHDNKAAANQATQQLQAGNQQAIDAIQGAVGPYVQNGQAASNTLAGLMGLGPLGGGSLPDSGFSVNQTMAAPAVVSRGMTRTMPEDAQPIGQAQARGTLASLGGTAPASSSSYRRMRAPNGDIENVPDHAVPFLKAQGAVEL